MIIGFNRTHHKLEFLILNHLGDELIYELPALFIIVIHSELPCMSEILLRPCNKIIYYAYPAVRTVDIRHCAVR